VSNRQIGRARPPVTGASLIYVLLLLVLLVTAALRLYELPTLPPGLWYDEAYYAADAAWVAETHSLQVFFPGNNGREPLMPYLGAASMTVLGQTPYALRLVSALAAVLTVALLYRWLTTMFAGDPDRRWLALIAAGGLTFSFWYLVMSRTGHRAALFPVCLVLTFWLFWRAWRCYQGGGLRGSWQRWAAAGVALGLSQYSYLTARLLPLVFLVFGIAAASIFADRQPQPTWTRRVGHWAGPAVMGIGAALVFGPLGLYFVEHPGVFAARSEDVFALDQIARGTTTWPQQILDAVRVFVDGSDPHWRHNLVDQPGFTLLESAGFWIGLLVSLRRIRRPAYSFLLISLFVLWLPALLSVPAVYTLRLSGLLPIYYAVMAVGWVAVARALGRLGTRWRPKFAAGRTRPAAAVSVLAAGAILVIPAYFVRWAQTPMVYSQYNGPLADLAGHVTTLATDADVLLPLPVYMHPTMHFLLGRQFREADATDTSAVPSDRPAVLVEVPDIYLIPNVVAINRRSSLMWLRRDSAGGGTAYLLHLARPEDLHALVQLGETETLVVGPTRDNVATLTRYRSLAPLLAAAAAVPPPTPVHYDWGHQVVLVGYQLLPPLIPPGGVTTLNLYWRGVTDQPAEYRTFVHVLDREGRLVNQVNGITVSEEQRWRRGHLAPEQHRLQLPVDAAPGPYLVRIGLIAGADEDADGEGSTEATAAPTRLPIFSDTGQALGDELELSLIYVGDDGHDPRVPDVVRMGRLGAVIELLGFSMPACGDDIRDICVRLHWQSIAAADRDYTAFVQLLDAESSRVAGYDAQPLDGLYPTSRWQPEEVVISDFTLTLPEELPAGTYRLVTGLYDLASGKRLPVRGVGSGTASDDTLTLRDLRWP
jgi:4-amino-4-deoxy-L-arabinose transferase-like glycosyltransferase